MCQDFVTIIIKYFVKRNFRGACSSVGVLKEYMIRKLVTPVLCLVGVVPGSAYDDVVYIRMESALTTAYHTSPKPLRTIGRKSVKSEHESSIYEFLLASGMFLCPPSLKLGRTDLRRYCPGLYTDGRKINESKYNTS